MDSEIISPGDDEYALLDERLVAFNQSKTDWDGGVFVIVLRKPNGSIGGGARGVVRMGAVEVRALWLDDDLRGQGQGERIMRDLEAEARSRGATAVLLDTYSFQARTFYEHLGYTSFGTFEYPNGISRTYLQKQI